MDDVKKAAVGKLKISEDVIITVARLAALDVKGVAGLGGEVNKMSKLKNNGPIRVSMIGDVAAIDMKIKVRYGNARTIYENWTLKTEQLYLELL